MLVPINEDINIDNLCDTTTPTRYIVELRAPEVRHAVGIKNHRMLNEKGEWVSATVAQVQALLPGCTSAVAATALVPRPRRKRERKPEFYEEYLQRRGEIMSLHSYQSRKNATLASALDALAADMGIATSYYNSTGMRVHKRTKEAKP